MNADGFTFADAPPEADRVVTIPADLSDRSILFATLADGLDLPSWFGRNWDALADALSSYEDPTIARLALSHEGLPLTDEDDLTTYLDILAEALEKRAEAPPVQPHLEVCFPTGLETRVRRLLAPR